MASSALRQHRVFCELIAVAFLVGCAAFARPVDAAEQRGFRVAIKDSERPDAAVVDEVNLYSKSYALVIGIDDYTAGWPRLSMAVADAEAVAQAMEARGFEVTLEKNLTARELEQTFRRFFVHKGQDPDSRLFVWYAGHGHSLSNGEGFLVPADAPRPENYVEFVDRALSLRRFGELTRLARSKHALTIFDSCFAGTIFKAARSVPPPAITRATTRNVRQFISSGDANQEVSDDGRFRRLFLDALSGRRRADANLDHYLTGSELGLFLTDAVINYTNDRQTPRYGKLTDEHWDLGDFVFIVEDMSAKPPPGPQSAALPPPKLPGQSGGFSLDDLHARADREREAIQAWQAHRQEMAAAFQQTLSFESTTRDSRLQRRAWERFLASYGEDDPYSTEDDDMRAQAQERLGAAVPTQYAWLTVRSNVSGDRLWIDGQPVGSTGAQSHKLSPGRHTIRVERDGYETFEQSLELSAGDREVVRAGLQQLAMASGGMIRVGGGPFFSGCKEDLDAMCSGDETASQARSVGGFQIDEYEVTVADYRECVNAGACTAPSSDGTWGQSGQSRHPVTSVSWVQAKTYCEWRGKRLPTEWEWEKAARGTDGRIYPWGNEPWAPDRNQANLEGSEDGHPWTSPVGSNPAGRSPYGVQDMAGNAWEWTSSTYLSDAKVIRGGSWETRPEGARTSNRNGYSQNEGLPSIGFRCAR